MLRINPATGELELQTMEFTELLDVPSSYTGQALKSLRVNSTETSLEFFTGAGLVDWGEIGGVLSNQTDLQAVLDTIVTDHGGLTGLTDDDHTQYLLANGTRELTADWDAGSYKITIQDITIDSMTSGSVLFAGIGGAISEDNTGLFFDSTNNFLGVGTGTPQTGVEIASIAGSNPAMRFTDVDVAHGMTALGFGPLPLTNTVGQIFVVNATQGGLTHLGITSGDKNALLFYGIIGTDTPTDSPIAFRAAKKNGTGKQNLATTELHSQWWNQDATVLLSIYGDGTLVGESSIKLKELAAAIADTAAYGQFWVENLIPNIPKFTNDAGTDFNLLQNLWATVTADSGSTTANTITDTLNIVGSGLVTTSIVGDTLTIDVPSVVLTNALLDGSIHSDTTAGTCVRGDIITGQGVSPTWTRLAKGTSNQYLVMDGTGTDVIWITSSFLSNIVEDLSPQLGANLDTNGFNVAFDTGKGILDENGNEQILFTTTANADTWLNITNGEVGGVGIRNPIIASDGAGADVTLVINSKGSGTIQIGAIGGGVTLGNSNIFFPNSVAAGSIFGFNSANTISAVTSTSGIKVAQNNAGTITWASGYIALISANETDATGTTTNANAITYSLSANTYSSIIIEAEVSLLGVANESDEVTFDLQINSVTKETLSLKQAATGAGDTFNLGGVVKYSQAQTAATTLRISATVVAGAATWAVKSLRVYGVI